jgi:hypothetical protein
MAFKVSNRTGRGIVEIANKLEFGESYTAFRT